LKELWSDRLIEILIANPSKPHFGQEALYGDLQILHYNLGDMDPLTNHIREDIEFQRGLVIKLSSGKFSQVWKTESYSSILTLETNSPRPQ
jgi:hypothetical protein